jgi:hypothetical protein
MNWKTILAIGPIILFTYACNAQDTGDKDPQEAAAKTEEAAAEETEAATEETEAATEETEAATEETEAATEETEAATLFLGVVLGHRAKKNNWHGCIGHGCK